MIRPMGKGLMREVAAPCPGFQDVGRSPGGPQDRFSWRCADILLGESPETRAWELVLPPTLEITRDAVGVLTGGSFDRVEVNGRNVSHGEVFRVRAGERIRWGLRQRGFRTLFALRPLSAGVERLAGRTRGAFRDVARWQDPGGLLRVIPGPECGRLPDPAAFLRQRWMTELKSSDEGLRITGGSIDTDAEEGGEMVSAPVADGTVQLTPDGLILLLRCRPTIGGYPRVFNLIDADVDLAAQCPPRRRVRFRLVSLRHVVEARRMYEEDLNRLRSGFTDPVE